MTKEERMQIEKYKKVLRELIEACEDIEYLIAVYTFASVYPNNRKGTGE